VKVGWVSDFERLQLRCLIETLNEGVGGKEERR
jgi:hypothetical protein